MSQIIRSHKYWRVLELVPGLITWLGLIAPLVLSIIRPSWVAIFIIIYTAIWLFRSIKLSYNLSQSFIETQSAIEQDWREKLKLLDNKGYRLKKAADDPKNSNHKNELRRESKSLQKVIEKNQFIRPQDIINAVILVTYKEGLEVVEPSIKSYIDSSFPSDRIIFVYAGEEREKETFLERAEILKKKYGKYFKKFIITVHPAGIPGEIKGKSANCTYAAKELKKYLDKEKIKYENIIVSNFDADTITHKDYFSELTYKYIITEDRVHKAFQPTHFFHNNIWSVPTMIRMVALSCTFFRLAESKDPMKFKSFSSRSNSFQTIVDVDYWDPAVIPEDSRQFWTAYILYNGKHKLIRLCCPVYMDAVLSDTYIKTFKSQYAQLRRWAWGASDFPFVFINLIKNKKIPFSKKFYHIFFFLENCFFWATGPIILTFTGWLPGLLNPNFTHTLLSYQAPRMASYMLTLASVGIIICAFLSIKLVPKQGGHKHPILDYLKLALQWILVPIVSIVLSAIPAIDAQTRLMFGRYLEYKVTEKVRK